METIKDRVRKLCQNDGISVSELEKKLSIGNGTIGKWNYSRPRAEVLAKVAAYFSVSSDYLLTGADLENLSALTIKDKQEIDLILMFRKLDGVSKYYFMGQIATIVRDFENSNRITVEDPLDAGSALSTSRVG